LCTFVEDVRTFYESGDPEFRKILDNIKRITLSIAEDTLSQFERRDEAA